jgi:hypothetical protein
MNAWSRRTGLAPRELPAKGDAVSSHSTFPTRIGAGWLLGAALVTAPLLPATATAGSLCFASSGAPAAPFMLPNAKLKKGRVNSVVGYLHEAGVAFPLSGVSVVSADGMRVAIGLDLLGVGRGGGGGGTVHAAGGGFVRALFLEPDRRLDVGTRRHRA